MDDIWEDDMWPGKRSTLTGSCFSGYNSSHVDAGSCCESTRTRLYLTGLSSSPDTGRPVANCRCPHQLLTWGK